MKGLILAAGYATRLHPLTKNKSKAMLPVGGKLMVERIVLALQKVEEINEIYIVTNQKFYDDFNSWATTYESKIPLTIINDGTSDDATKLGAIGDIALVLREKQIEEDLMIVAGDNLFTFSLADYFSFYKEKNTDCVCVQKFENTEVLKHFAVAILDDDQKVTDIEEKPANPKSNIGVFASYIYKKETLPLFFTYLDEGNPPDSPGSFLPWLYKRQDVHGYFFKGECDDIGTIESYNEACEKYKLIEE
ncbi:MAG: nucleotidyltransferase family protein [Bacillota bacterium]